MREFPVFLEPLDISMFRDNRPFSPEEGARATSGYTTPPQSVVYGSLRTMLLRRAPDGGWPATLAIGERGAETSGLRLGPVWLAAQGAKTEAWMPCPADLVRLRPGTRGEKTGFQVPVSRGWSNLPVALGRMSPVEYRSGSWEHAGERDGLQPVEGQMLGVSGTGSLLEYLSGEGAELVAVGSRMGSEVHTGIARTAETGTVEEGKLFSKEVWRLRTAVGPGLRWEPTGYYTEILTAGDEFPESDVLTLGGESRPFRFRRAEAVLDWEGLRAEIGKRLAGQVSEEGVLRFRLILQSPGIFAGGWRPALPVVAGGTLRLLGACVPRMEVVGGWDMAGGRPKAAKRLAAAGSVYFVEARGSGTAEELAESILRVFWRTSALCAPDATAEQAGWGVSLVGIYPNAK